MPLIISIRPSPFGWGVKVEGVCNEMSYRTGAEAETAARTLAEGLSREGRSTEIQLLSLNGSLTARVVSVPQTPTQTSWGASA